MRYAVLLTLLSLAACATANIEQSTRNEIAVITSAPEGRINWTASVRVRPQQVLVPSRADGQEEFCSTSPVLFQHNGRPQPLCFRDTKNNSRFNQAFFPWQGRRGSELTVDIPYMLQPFPCVSCRPPAVDLTRVSSPQVLAEHSIAPPELRPFVQLALSGSPDVDAAIARSTRADPARTKAIVDLATREVRDRRAVAICSSQNPGGGAAMLGLIGAIATIAGSRSEEACMDEYLRTGVMPIPPAPPPEMPPM
ncbi:hypothetical protein J8J14_01790 [Roseomonas sp. SSH11]|uniref:Lipoprotein n=1 Tax=Pararoseomonas baculiformis TaxID=2820812 RepID=A0ABS4AAG5_9PROT|nr:hypothetical protein [Pararoseomonas baculiformis]MBP0443498.1 hypothetical protein [Pararoseomonas baculiformis]